MVECNTKFGMNSEKPSISDYLATACVVEVTTEFKAASLKGKGLYFYLLNEKNGLPITGLDFKTAALSKWTFKKSS